ncbi:MAG: hypothetical protein FWG14_12280 [Peptococcaceae bacterium]|nr:hypothetical protein [Peptococcaceae bacterium]
MQVKQLPNGVDKAKVKNGEKEDPCKEAHDANEAQRTRLEDKPTRVAGSTSDGIDDAELQSQVGYLVSQEGIHMSSPGRATIPA